jgi:hypothetical protein
MFFLRTRSRLLRRKIKQGCHTAGYGQLQVLVRPLANGSNWSGQAEIVVHARLNQRMQLTKIKRCGDKVLLNQSVRFRRMKVPPRRQRRAAIMSDVR